MLGGRVKTLHPNIHGGILARRDVSSDQADMKAQGVVPIDLVVVNLYPFREAVAKGLPPDEVIENIDIGGPSMIRSAAKNAAHVAVVVDPADYGTVLAELQQKREVHVSTRRRLQARAFAHTAAYDGAIAAWLSEQLAVANKDDAGAFADSDHGVIGTRHVFELPVEKFVIEILGFGKVSSVEFNVTKWIGHRGLLKN